MKFIDLLVYLKGDPEGKQFIQYLMDKYASGDILYDNIKDWIPFYTKEDSHILYDMLLTLTTSEDIGVRMNKDDDKVDRTLNESNPMFIRFIKDDREPIVQEGDEYTSNLPRYVLSPFRGLSSGLIRREDESV
jgi:hypothetical protein